MDSSVPLTSHDPKDLGLICLIKKRKIDFRTFSDLKLRSWIFLKKRTLRPLYHDCVIRLNSVFSTGTLHLNISQTDIWSGRSTKVLSLSRYHILKSWSSMLLKQIVTLRILSTNLCREKLIYRVEYV